MQPLCVWSSTGYYFGDYEEGEEDEGGGEEEGEAAAKVCGG